jgi:adenine-specific DNA methylase
MTIKDIRKKLNFSQEQLAGYIGVSHTTINRWETEKATPSKKYQTILDAISNQADKKISANNDEINLRPIQYLGSKKRLLQEILAIVGNLVKPNDSICDLFSGSGVVTHALSQDYKVISVDIQKYATILSETLVNQPKLTNNLVEKFLIDVQNDKMTKYFFEIFKPIHNLEIKYINEAEKGNGFFLSEFIESCSVYKFMNSESQNIPDEIKNKLKEVKKNLLHTDNEIKKKLLITTYYGGIYFSFEQALYMDSILNKANEQTYEKSKNEITAVVLSTASYIVNTVGKQFAQPIKLTDPKGKIKKLLLERTIRDRNISVFNTFKVWYEKYLTKRHSVSKQHEFYHMDYRNFFQSYEGHIDCFYADPPYTIDHYSRFYHVLETISLYDFPIIEKKIKLGQEEFMRGMYRNDRHQSPFSISSKVREGFEELFNGVDRFKAPLILSYSPSNLDQNGRPRLLELSEIKSLAQKYFPFVYLLEPKQHSHRKLNASQCNVKTFNNAEIFIVCTYKGVDKWKNI